jgi:hypothetical protein
MGVPKTLIKREWKAYKIKYWNWRF